MLRTCKECRRVNPGEAVYCYHDGAFLGGQGNTAAVNFSEQPFTVPFVLSGGRVCHNFNQLAVACQAAPAAVLEMLRKGHLEAFLAGQGRIDLAEAAHAAARHPDREQGLDEFLGRLPAVSLREARLCFEPAVLDLGTVPLGTDKRGELVLFNGGQRLLHGSATCADCPWLSFGDKGLVHQKLFQFTDRMVLPVRVRGRHLRAYRKPQEVEILLESNGGKAKVIVRVLVPVQPFPSGVLAGALSPRQLAEKAHQAPAEAAVLIESGAVAQWYRSNNWEYPVRGPTAAGVAAVQQLFEALGMVKPPAVEVSEEVVRLRGHPGDALEHVLAITTQEARMVVAHGTSSEPWLRIGRTVFRGRSAFLPLSASVPPRPGAVLHADVAVTANGNQRFKVPVTLTVIAPVARPAPRTDPGAARAPSAAAGPVRNAPPPAPVPVGVPLPPVRPGRRRRPWFLTLSPAALLALALLGGVARDILIHPQTRGPAAPQDDTVPRLAIRFHDTKRDDVLEKLWLPEAQPTMRFGLVTLTNGQEVGSGATVRRLTFDPWGRTNNTCLRFDNGDERLFGGPQGRWEEIAARRWKDDQGKEHGGTRSTWFCEDKRVAVIQFVELVRGEQSNLLDTCRVSYRIVNRDTHERPIGIRFLLDTFIGGNDGVPFTIPGEPDLCNTMKDLPSQTKEHRLPDFLQALEKPDLEHPGTIAHLRLKLDKLEAPARVLLGAWPNDRLRVVDRKANGPETLWNVPLLPMKTMALNDSAIVMYWDDRPLKPGATRDVGFEYGLGELASQGSQLATTVDGNFRPQGELTVVAYVGRGVPEDASLTLTLPDGFQFLEGDATQPVPKLPRDAQISSRPVTWKVRAGTLGKYQFTLKSSAGLSQSVPVEIKSTIFD